MNLLHLVSCPKSHAYLLFASLFLFSSLASYSWLRIQPPSPPLNPSESNQVLSATDQAIASPSAELIHDHQQLGVLLLGYGGPGHQGGYLTDVIQLAFFDFEKKLFALISIPRDLWVALPSGLNQKINAVFSLGLDRGAVTTNSPDHEGATSGAQAVKNIINQLTGLPTHYFISVDFVGFQRAIGYGLDGIEVQLPEAFDDPWYPIRGEELNPCDHTPEEIADLSNQYSGFELEKQFPCRYEHVSFPKGTMTMDGGAALKFTRSRHSSSDFARSSRQQLVLSAVIDKLFSLNALQNIPRFYQQLASYTQTDLNIDTLNYLAPLLKSIPDLKVIHLNLSTDNALNSSQSPSGAFILIPKTGFNDYTSIRQFINSKLN